MIITIDFCGITFGHSLEFFADGTYAGVVGALLPGRSYSVLPDGRLKLATKGGISVYPFSISGDVLTIQATSSTFSCKLQYQRAQ